eukprot:4311606-Prymnesium_polylepis.2
MPAGLAVSQLQPLFNPGVQPGMFAPVDWGSIDDPPTLEPPPAAPPTTSAAATSAAAMTEALLQRLVADGLTTA